jgi:hypothetical protein
LNNNMNSNRGNNNNNNNNNRRRGRGNNNRPQGGGGQQLNRIDSRARGNAPQMLEKYRKLAHDAHLNGDRVQEESFLQYADHYFRVIADQRARQDEPRAPRSNDRWQEGGEGEREESEDSGEFGGEGEYQPYAPQSYNRSEREERPREERPREERPREERPREERPRNNRPRDIAPVEVRAAENRVESPVDTADSGASVAEGVTAFEPAENPFVREARSPRGLRPRREDRSPRPPRAAQADRNNDDKDSASDAPGIDPAILPPPISIQRENSTPALAEETEVAAPRRRAVRRPRPPVDDAGEVVEVVS